jgi:hypothetical protein
MYWEGPQHPPFHAFQGMIFPNNVWMVSCRDEIGMGGSCAVVLVIESYMEAMLHAFQEVPYELHIWVCSESS